jgi:hypothetical protein
MAQTLNTGPDVRYGCEMDDGKKFVGSLRKVAKDAAMATHKDDRWVVSWSAPGATRRTRDQRTEQLKMAYQQELDGLGRAKR